MNEKAWSVQIAEDSATQAQRLTIILEDAGYRVSAAKNGRAALDMIRENRPDLVISDITMPIMDGISLCREIKSDETLRDIPVILLTALPEPVETIRALEAKADYFITKPYCDDYLIGKIEFLRQPDATRTTVDDANGAEIMIGGERHMVTSGRGQILKLLLSTYENAVEQNRQLSEANMEVQRLNQQLGDRLTDLNAEVAERERAEEGLKQTLDELGRSNSDLEQFAYVVSHDLQEPLRKITAFADLLERRHAGELNEEAQGYVKRMVGGAERMGDLIRDVLALSRVTTKARPFKPINLNETVKEVLSDLETRIEDTGADVQVGDLPSIDADSTQMHQLLQNLIGNALKFHKKEEGEKPVVRVEATTTEGLCELRISDNGIGFDAKHAEQIFNMFRRLHTRGTYEGTGIGLAICRKIAERHHGSIEATSEAGEGATFTIKVPIKQDNSDSGDRPAGTEATP